jgi:hypothetical protein
MASAVPAHLDWPVRPVRARSRLFADENGSDGSISPQVFRRHSRSSIFVRRDRRHGDSTCDFAVVDDGLHA